jgi:hypothetical protein
LPLALIIATAPPEDVAGAHIVGSVPVMTFPVKMQM